MSSQRTGAQIKPGRSSSLFTNKLHVELFHDGNVEATRIPGGLRLSSNFDLLAKHDGVVVGDAPGTPRRTWRWTPDGGLTPSGSSSP